MFDCSKYLSALTPRLDDGSHNITPKRLKTVRAQMSSNPYRPRTMGDHQAAETEARRILDARIDSPTENTPEIVTDDEAIDATHEIRAWAADVILDAKIWEYVMADLMAAYDLTGKRRSAAA